MKRHEALLAVFFLMVGGRSIKAQDYTSETLLVQQVSERTYQHISFLDTESFGKVPCNGLIIVNEGEAIVFDTPATEETSSELIDWIQNELHATIKAIIPTHFHQDCLAGLDEFHRHQVPSYGTHLTVDLARQNRVSAPQHGFDEQLELALGNERVTVAFVGEGHTKDNVVGYFPAERVLFGGCLIKEVGAGKGNLEDANTVAWPRTVSRLQEQFPEAEIIVPGHGARGGTELLDYTRKLFLSTQ